MLRRRKTLSSSLKRCWLEKFSFILHDKKFSISEKKGRDVCFLFVFRVWIAQKFYMQITSFTICVPIGVDDVFMINNFSINVVKKGRRKMWGI